MSGHDRARDAERVFRIDRIEDKIELGTPGAYELRPARGPELVRTWEFGDGEPIEATVRIDPKAALWAKVHLREDEIETNDDGSINVTLKVHNRDAFRDWVLTFIEDATIIEPEALRTELIDWLDAVAEAHA